jgi:hypothetical protein
MLERERGQRLGAWCKCAVKNSVCASRIIYKRYIMIHITMENMHYTNGYVKPCDPMK